MKVPFYNYKDLFLNNKSKYLKIIENNLKTGEFILGKELQKFETNFSKFLKCKYSIGTSSATSALEIGLKCLKNNFKKEILIPSHTFVATIDAIYNAGFIPKIVDIGFDGLIETSELDKNINKNTFAILSVNLNGMSCNYDFLLKISKKYKIHLIEDNAQAFGAKYKNIFTGNFGTFSAFSFYPTKILGCFGDGGALVTNNYNIYKKAKMIRNHGRNDKGDVLFWGENSRLDNVQAAILNLNLQNITSKIKKRIQIARFLYNGLKHNPNIRFNERSFKKNYYFDVFQNLEILAKNRNNLKVFLKKNKIETIIQWKGLPLNQLKLKNVKLTNLKNTNLYFKECLCIPLNNSLKKSQLVFIIKKINQFYNFNEN